MFISKSSSWIFLFLCSVLAINATHAEDPKGGKINYVREDIPAIPMKPYEGETYKDMIPDTFDIAERAELGINVLTRATNPNADHELFFKVDFLRNPVAMVNDWNDWCQGKFMEALPLLRSMTGSRHNADVDRVWQEVVLKSIGPDGLYYIPLGLEGRPWGKTSAYPQLMGTVAMADGSFKGFNDPAVDQFSHPWLCGRMISVINVYYLRDKNPIWIEINRRMIDRLLELAIHKSDDRGSYCYFPNMVYMPRAKYDPSSPQAAMPKGIWGGEINGRLIQGAAHYYQLTGYEPARELAEKITRFMRFHCDYFAEDGRFSGQWGHFHAHTIYMIGMLDIASAVGDRELMEFVRRSYEWAKSPEAFSCSLIGYFPEHTKAGCHTSWCEGCSIGDMIAIALKLSEYGAGDFYGDVERWTRNHFAESQLTRCDWIVRQAEKQPGKAVGPHQTANQVPERNIGAFAGWSSANDWWIAGSGIMHCCTGNGTRTLYYIWRHILDYTEGRLRVNMLLNRASEWADVHSYVPYEGRVDIKVKKTCQDVLVHAPEWIESGDQIVVTVDDKPRSFTWEGRYIDLGEVKNAQTIAVTFPITERTVKESIGGKDYTLILKGNTVVFIDPAGKRRPLYQREHYRNNRVRWREVERFVPKQELAY